jgi:hypothetical protein
VFGKCELREREVKGREVEGDVQFLGLVTNKEKRIKYVHPTTFSSQG